MDDTVVYAVVLVTMVLLFLIALFLVLFQKSARNRIEAELELMKTKLTYEEELKKVSFEVTEHLLQHMSRELHDNVGQLHTTMNIQVENLIFDSPELLNRFVPLKSSLAEVIFQTRSLARAYNNEYIGSRGLLNSLNLEITRIKSLSRFDVHYVQEGNQTNLSLNQELMVFRIFQEIVQNAIRHSVAENLYVELSSTNSTFKLKVEDDGRGFDKEMVLQTEKSSGLANIIKRASLANLRCTIDSNYGSGTHFEIQKGNEDSFY